jgi:glycosyltransferase involved in cell wall biosynthesis
VKVVVADPPAYTPPYDHALAAALARAGVEVELATSHFRFGPVPAADGYDVSEMFYRRSSRLPGGRPRLAVKALEHALALARLASMRPDVLHLQWVGAPEVDRLLLRARAPLVFTAHDLLPRRTGHRTAVWQRLFRRFDRIVVHSESGRRSLAAFGVPDERLRVIAHPVFPTEVSHRDDGRTVLALGSIRPYKQLGDALAAVQQVDGARLLVAGDARGPLDALRSAGGDRVTWRLGWLTPPELADVLAATTVAVFPYRPEIDQSGALLQALGAGVPAVVYDVGGLGEVVRTFGAGCVVEPGDVDALGKAIGELLDDPAALAAARAGAERARDELTWEHAAAAHIAVYRELTA